MMTHDLLIGGIILTTLVPAVFGALVATVLLSLLLARIGFYRLVWHRPLAELAIFCIMLALVVLLVVDPG